MRILPESGGGIGLGDCLAAIGDNREAMLVLAFLVDADSLHSLDLPDGAGNRAFAATTLDAAHFRGVSSLGGKDRGGKKKPQEDEEGQECLHDSLGAVHDNASFMQKSCCIRLALWHNSV